MSSTTTTTMASQRQLGAAKPTGKTVDQANNGAGTIVGKKSAKPKKVAAPKSSMMLDLLTRKSGCTLEELQMATGWQAHSVRGFLSGTVKKKLGFQIESAVSKKGVRRYKAIKSKTA